MLLTPQVAHRTALAALAALIAACGGTTSDTTAPVTASVTVTLAQGTVVPGAKVAASVVARDAEGRTITGQSIEWASSKATVATVSGEGEVTAVSLGSAAIIASVGGKSASATLFVVPPPRPGVALVISVDSLLDRGTGIARLIRNEDSLPPAARRIDWSSSNPAVAIIDQGGRVTLMGPGSTALIGRSEGGDGVFGLVVPPVVRAEIVGHGRAKVGDAADFDAYTYTANNIRVVLPVTWSVDDPAFGAVDSRGMLTASLTGALTLRAVVADMTVTRPVETYDWTVTMSPGTITASLPIHRDDWGVWDPSEYPTLELSCTNGTLGARVNAHWTGGANAPVGYYNVGAPTTTTWVGSPDALSHPAPSNSAVRTFFADLQRAPYFTFYYRNTPGGDQVLSFRTAGIDARVAELLGACP